MLIKFQNNRLFKKYTNIIAANLLKSADKTVISNRQNGQKICLLQNEL